MRTALVLVCLGLAVPAAAADAKNESPAQLSGVNAPPAAAKSKAKRTEAELINERNGLVIHAGPGRPSVGGAYVPQHAAAKKGS